MPHGCETGDAPNALSSTALARSTRGTTLRLIRAPVHAARTGAHTHTHTHTHTHPYRRRLRRPPRAGRRARRRRHPRPRRARTPPRPWRPAAAAAAAPASSPPAPPGSMSTRLRRRRCVGRRRVVDGLVGVAQVRRHERDPLRVVAVQDELRVLRENTAACRAARCPVNYSCQSGRFRSSRPRAARARLSGCRS